ncbi:MAG: SusC/RagA family TonB-linked outer membrane protein [Dysgonamonadaceae bacterium]|jgi:iron complex outermembrane receptor protein|nr:SusC/RagA family TonB-linked outer membrane protein [Dysgonamonadaceae bacterium]
MMKLSYQNFRKRFKSRIFLLLLFSFLPFAFAEAQNVVTGTVIDQNNDPLVGVSVSVKNTTHGTMTDLNGHYSINVKDRNAVLVFSYIGYSTQEHQASQAVIDVTLLDDTKLLDEVVVTALGIKRDPRALGYATSTIRSEDMIKAGVTNNPLATLYGKAAGVGVQATAAGPMGGIKINVRGSQGLSSDIKTRPLFVVDGVPIYDSDSNMASRGYDPLNSFDYGSAVNDINVEDIESMEILKGAKAAVLYGSRGANGVVLISTKNGAGTRGLGVQLSYGLETEVPYQLINFQNEYGSGVNEYDMSYTDDTKTTRRTVSSRFGFGPKFDGSQIMFFDGSMRKYQAYEDNYMAPFQNGSTSSFSAALQGGNEKGNMRLSVSNFDYKGILPNEGQVKNTLSFNGQMTVSPFARFEFVQNMYNVKSTNRRPNLQRFISYGAYNRDYDIATAMNSYKDEKGYRVGLKGLANIDDKGWGWPSAFAGDETGFFSMLWNQNENRNHDNRLHTTTAAKAFFTPLSYLTLTLQGSLDYNDTEFIKKNKIERRDPDNGQPEGGVFRDSRERNYIQDYIAMLSFNKKFQDTWNLDLMAGTEYLKEDYTSIGVGTWGGLKFPDYWMLDNGKGWPGSYESGVSSYGEGHESMYSVYGQAMLSYNMEYILEFQARNDWASTLPKLNRSYFYPGASLVWNFTERFQIPKINYGKLRLSWADTGRPAKRYYAYKSYSMNTLPAPNTNINDVTGPGDLFSGDLKPERNREFEAGFNLRMFKQNRLELDFAYYNKIFYNQIMGVPLSSTTGASNIRINAGEINNQGLEFFIKGTPVKTSVFSWELALNFAKQWDKVVKLYPGITQFNQTASGIDNRAEEGQPMGQLWMQDYVKDENGNRIVNSKGYYQISDKAEDQICVGSINPDFYGGLLSNFYFQGKWGMLNLMAGFDFRHGGKVLSYTSYYLMGNGVSEETLKYRDAAHGGMTWTETLSDGSTRERHDGLILPGVKDDGTPNDIVINAYDYYRSFLHDDSKSWQPDLLKENNYIKFREMALNYTFSKKISSMLRLQKLTIGLTARNLFYIYKSLPHIDAEAMLGTSGSSSWIENTNYPGSRSYGFKINVSF